eukprot:gene2869-5633_t
MLTRIRNGQRAKKDSVLTPASNLRASVLEVLQREGYIRGYSEDTSGKHKALRIELKYFEGEPAIKHVARVSKPAQGRRGRGRGGNRDGGGGGNREGGGRGRGGRDNNRGGPQQEDDGIIEKLAEAEAAAIAE